MFLGILYHVGYDTTLTYDSSGLQSICEYKLRELCKIMYNAKTKQSRGRTYEVRGAACEEQRYAIPVPFASQGYSLPVNICTAWVPTIQLVTSWKRWAWEKAALFEADIYRPLFRNVLAMYILHKYMCFVLKCCNREDFLLNAHLPLSWSYL